MSLLLYISTTNLVLVLLKLICLDVFSMISQFLPVSDDPTKVLRTKTKGIGTDNYRAPEVNAGLHSYDPSAADIWSLGVTLFFLVRF